MIEASPNPPLALQGLLPDELAATCSIELADARRIVSLAHRRGELPTRAPATIRRAALDAARARCHVPTLEVVERRPSAVDPFVKYAFRLHDGAIIESVRIPLEKAGRYAVCVSSQAGCALACAFCATGRMGLTRNLEAWEIVEQVRLVRRDLEAEHPGARVHGIVFQGMGEPLANADRVLRAIRVLSEPSAQAIDRRNITVCTAGLPTGIRRLAEEAPGVRLGVSLGSVRPGARRALMPIDSAHPLAEVLAAAGEHARTTGYAPMWAYTLLLGQNDTDEDAGHLATLARDFARTHGVPPRISLIPFNSIGDDALQRSDRMEAFRNVLFAAGVGSIVRYSGGGDVGAACGQLARTDLPRRGAASPRGARVTVDPGISPR
ncbi:23S rRNA (adenine(2503)-C(2))-methyltransferase RlmN [Chondromyces apiculatus]|uniref:Ribosomal RNA large subunit methyltransferase N n=1 Tax=Chondromyces apiculatus DSM 436 TaxID=1192034 RepID=A0A017TGM5_9BACT|nr:23S rRNA (adenine(2503)-C(2))-methyltransferase RlmN [Chondromyces apiculatus]EYF07970.1 Ribosomal RNA large subunit methyltransferase N [Chondromyces apiculatus DSM 436]